MTPEMEEKLKHYNRCVLIDNQDWCETGKQALVSAIEGYEAHIEELTKALDAKYAWVRECQNPNHTHLPFPIVRPYCNLPDHAEELGFAYGHTDEKGVKEIIICGQPEDNDESHDCDDMGCTSVSHVVKRIKVYSFKGYGV